MNTERANRLGTLPTPPSPVMRGTCLLVLLGLELLTITIVFDAQGLIGAAPWWAVWLSYAPACLSIGLGGVAAFLVIVGPRVLTPWQALRTPSHRHHWSMWLALHVVALVVFTLITAAIFEVDTEAVRSSVLWPVSWTLSTGPHKRGVKIMRPEP